MSEAISIADLHFLFFVIPGFITVWTYRYFTYSKKQGDFELLGLSFFWGIAIAAVFTAFLNKDASKQLFANPYAACLFFSFLGAMISFIAASYSDKNRISDALRIKEPIFILLLKKIVIFFKSVLKLKN